MATNIQLIDVPSFVTDEEVNVGKSDRGWTWLSMCEVINWLNFHARKILPFSHCHDSHVGLPIRLQKTTFIYPVDGPSYSTRYLTVVVGVSSATYTPTGAAVDVTVTSSTDATGQTLTASVGSVAAATSETEADTVYLAFRVAITSGKNELITIDCAEYGDDGGRIMGFGAWELPPTSGGAGVAMSSGGGLAAAKANLVQGSTSLLDPVNYYSG
jgi:hypothetical protein